MSRTRPASSLCLAAWLTLLAGTVLQAGDFNPASAETLARAGHWKRVRALAEQRLRESPNDARAVCLLSRSRLAFGDLDGALALARRAVALEDGSSDYHFQLAEVYGRMAAKASMFAAAGLARKFKGELDASLSRNPKNLDALDALMQYSFQAPGLMGGDKGKARAIAEELVQLSPVRGRLAQAELAREENNPAKVEECLRKAVQADPRSYEARAELARFYIMPAQRKMEPAEKHAREAVRLDASRAEGYAVLAKVLALEQRWGPLEAALSASESDVPDDPVPYFEAADALRESGADIKRGEAYARKYLAQEEEGEEPDAAHAHRLLGLILEKQGRRAEALAEMETAVRLSPGFKTAKEDLKRLRNGST